MDDYKRQAVDLVASSGRSIGGQGTWPAPGIAENIDEFGDDCSVCSRSVAL
jgi:hypothetical protein